MVAKSVNIRVAHASSDNSIELLVIEKEVKKTQSAIKKDFESPSFAVLINRYTTKK